MPRTRSAACAFTYTEVTRRSECPSRLCRTCGCICLIASLAKVWRSQCVEARVNSAAGGAPSRVAAAFATSLKKRRSSP